MQYPVILAFPISFPYISAKYFYLKEINVGILKEAIQDGFEKMT